LDAENFILNEIKEIKIINKNNEFLLSAIAAGDEIDKKYNVAGIVKAITYNEMEIKEKDGKWTITAVVDR
ncbi:MAG: archease, partial [Candidatus Aenigmarchaeota archaeon]|nr:archease [Candidatus Aenigmarchaeota archaeon]